MNTESRQEQWMNHLGGFICLLMVAVYFGLRGDLAGGGEMFGTKHFKPPEGVVPLREVDPAQSDSEILRMIGGQSPLPSFYSPESGLKGYGSAVYDQGFGENVDDMLLGFHRPGEENRPGARGRVLP
jgi:hypothetical protein